MKTLKPGSFGHRGLIGKKVVAKEANRVSAKCAIEPMCDWGLLPTAYWLLGALGVEVEVRNVSHGESTYAHTMARGSTSAQRAKRKATRCR
jgi:hypothetical protein